MSPEKRRGDIDGSVPPQNRQPSRVANDEDAYGERPLGETDGQQHVDEDRAAKDFATQATQAGSARDEPKAKVKSFKMMLDGTITSGMLARVQESKTINRDIYYFDVGYNRQATVRPQNGTGHIELMSLLKVGDVVDDLVLWRRDKSLNAGVNLDALKAVVQKRRVAKKKSMDEVVEGTVVTGKLVSIKLHERRGRLPIFFFDVGFEKPAALIAPARNVTLKALTSALKPGDVLEGLVLKKSRGRLMAEAQIKSLEAFCANRDVKIRRVQDLQNGTVSNGILVNIRRMGARSYFQVDVGYERDAMLDIENGTEAEFIAMKLSPGDMLSGLTLTVNQKNSIRATPDIEHLWARTAGKVQQYLEPAWKLRTLELDDADGMVVTGRLANIKFVPYRPMPIYFFDVGCERPAALADGVGTEAEEYNALAAKLKVGDVLPDLVLKVNKKRRIMAVATLDSLRVATSIMEQLGDQVRSRRTPHSHHEAGDRPLPRGSGLRRQERQHRQPPVPDQRRWII